MTIALTIAGSDSGGGAGIQADLHVFAAHGVHGTCAVTAVTAQSSVGVADWASVEVALVVAQIQAVATDMTVSAAKTGMLGTAAMIEAVADAAGRFALGPLVVDPVMVAKSGDPLLDPAAERAYVERLFPRAAIVTPNLLEAARLLGRPVDGVAGMRAAAEELLSLGPGAVLLKGGSRLGEDAGEAVDVYADRDGLVELRAPRVDTPHTHGTGCALSAAICARLALGAGVLEAVRGAKAYVTEALRRAYPTGKGRGTLDHLHPLRMAAAGDDSILARK